MTALPELLLVSVLVLLNAAFAGSEMALVSLRPAQIERLKSRGARGRQLAELAADPNRFLATIQVGITLAGFLASAAAAVSLAEPLTGPLSFFGDAAEPVAIILVTLVLAYLTLVFGELAPKRIAMQRAEAWALAAARPLAALSSMTRPAVWLLGRSTDIVVTMFGGDPTLDREAVSGEELRTMVESQEEFTDEHRQILSGAFEIAERSLREIVRPRGDVFVLDEAMDVAAALTAMVEAGRTRAPVAADGDLDRAVAFVHLRDLVGDAEKPLAARTQNLLAFPETVAVLDALRRMQAGRQQIAVVFNEHGGAEGIVTLEDLLEELVGEIYDEADPDLVGLVQAEDGTVDLPGRFPMHDLADLGIDLPPGEYSTVAGFVLDRVGRIPEVGDVVAVDTGWTVRVTGVDQRHIVSVRILPVEQDPASYPVGGDGEDVTSPADVQKPPDAAAAERP